MIFVQLRLIFLSIILVGIQSPFLLEETLFASEKRVLDESSDTEGKLPAKVTEISLPRFLLGGAIGTTFGFGVGHGIQYRYLKKGWLFSAGEGAGIGLILHCLNNLPKNGTDKSDGDWDDDDWDDFQAKQRPVPVKFDLFRTCADSLRSKNDGSVFCLLGAGIFLGFKAWEIIDVWSLDGDLKIAGEMPNQNFFRIGFVPSVFNSRFYPGLGVEYDF